MDLTSKQEIPADNGMWHTRPSHSEYFLNKSYFVADTTLSTRNLGLHETFEFISLGFYVSKKLYFVL